MTIELILVDAQLAVCKALRERFDGLPQVTIVNGGFEDLPAFDCMVSPANSFGLMDGGIDAAIIRFFGAGLMARVQERILADYLGEQPVGTSIIVETGQPDHPYIAHTPTMRVPMEITQTDNVYNAMWAMLVAVHHHNRQAALPIRRVACPGLGTGVGKMPYHEAARQMALAYRHYLNPPMQLTWETATGYQNKIIYGGVMGQSLPPNMKI